MAGAAARAGETICSRVSCRISTVILRRYLSGAGRTPDDVAVRLHALALIVGDLAGAYDDAGIRRWFARRRTALGNRAPVDVLAAGCGSLTIPRSGRCTSSRRVDRIVHHAIMLGFCRNSHEVMQEIAVVMALARPRRPTHAGDYRRG